MSLSSLHPFSFPKSRSFYHPVRRPHDTFSAVTLMNCVAAKLKELWIIPIFFVVTTLVSMGVAYLLGLMLRLRKSQRWIASLFRFARDRLILMIRSFAIAAAMFMNSNSLPIALMQSLVITVPGLKWGDDDNKDAMVGRALTYLVLYSTLGMVVRSDTDTMIVLKTFIDLCAS